MAKEELTEYDGSEPLPSPINEKFAQESVNAKSQSDAYRKTFPEKELTPESLWALASALTKDFKVALRIKFLRKTLTDQCIWTREEAVKALKDIVTTTTVGEDGKERKEALPKDRVAASIALNKMHGYDAATQIEISGANGNPLGLAEFFKLNNENNDKKD